MSRLVSCHGGLPVLPARADPGGRAGAAATEEDLDLDREIEYAFDADEPMAGRAPSGDVE